MIEVSGLRKSFAEVTALNGVSFSAQNAKVTGLLGPNGAGKSTSLRILYGLLKPDTGWAKIDGLDVSLERLKAQARLGVLPDGHGLYARLTAREHMAFFGRLHGISPDVLEQRSDELIRMLDMQTIADRRTEGFSQGERMKVCLARALIHSPDNIVLDEPTNGLDVMTTRKVRELINELRQLGLCVLFSSHIMHEVSRLCDEIVIIAEGQVVAQGVPDAIRESAGEENLEDAFVTLSERAARL
ncbi:MAG: ATP-binding cassette domain-containing protein [Gammaproteobacteria bacterium TMED182]|nr:ABC transporter [Gammaproteobacteria bacterium]RPG51658.1 MAG: ATP-binding cassette domain-containing protein [Gammaproteobacteria bacterium TMED182]